MSRKRGHVGAAGNGNAMVHVERKDAGENTQDIITDSRFAVPLPVGVPAAKVRIEGSTTRNLGNYESCRVSVMVELPCVPTEAGIDAAAKWASAKVDALIETELEQAGVPDQPVT